MGLKLEQQGLRSSGHLGKNYRPDAQCLEVLLHFVTESVVVPVNKEDAVSGLGWVHDRPSDVVRDTGGQVTGAPSGLRRKLPRLGEKRGQGLRKPIGCGGYRGIILNQQRLILGQVRRKIMIAFPIDKNRKNNLVACFSKGLELGLVSR